MISMLKFLLSTDREFYFVLRNRFKIRPRNIRLYKLAFLHKSASIVLPDKTVVNNERLEFLGDAVIDAVIADYLFHKFPGEREGFLTRMRSRIVNRTHLDSVANKMGLVDIVVAYATNAESMKRRICGDAFEALMGAMYLDRGFKKTHRYITGYVLKQYIDVEQVAHTETDFKSRLIEWGQKYRLKVGFEHIGEQRTKPGNSWIFSVQVTISDVPIAKGSGKSKKEAEQLAAQKALDFFSSSKDFTTESLVKYLDKMKNRRQKPKN